MSETDDILLNELSGYDDSELRQLIERVAQIEEMTQHPGWAFYTDFVTAQTVTRQKLILNGSCQSIEDYTKQTGWVRGAQAAINAPASLREKLDRIRTQLEEENSPTEREDDGKAAA